MKAPRKQFIAWITMFSAREFGASLSMGDFNGDNLDDVAIGVPGFSDGSNAGDN